MAEIVGITASIITLGAFSVQIFKFSKKIYDASQKVPYLADEIMRTVLILQSSATAIDSCHTSLQHLELKGDDTAVLKEMRINGTLQSLAEAIKMVSKRFANLLNEIDKVQSRVPVLSVFKWSGRKPRFEDLTVELECIKTTIMIIMIVTLLESNRLEAQKLSKMLKGREMANVRAAVEQRLERDNQVYIKNLGQQQKMAKSLLLKRRQIQTTGSNKIAPPPTEPILEALGSLLNMAQDIRKARGRAYTPTFGGGNSNRRKSSVRMGYISPAPPLILVVAVLNPGKEYFKMEVTSSKPPNEKSMAGALAAKHELTATVDGGLPNNIAVMAFNAVKRVDVTMVEAVGDQNEVVKFASGRLEPVIGETKLTHRWKHGERESRKIISVYVVANLECDIVVGNYM